MRDVYLGLGGNIGNTLAILRSALQQIDFLDGVSAFQVSRFYQTTPVSDIPQTDYINAVCTFKTGLEARELLALLQGIEKAHGKVPKPKNHPRSIDIDLLFFGLETINDVDCEVPHPRWQERLFVVRPLMDLVETISISDGNKVVQIDLNKLIYKLQNQINETVSLLPET